MIFHSNDSIHDDPEHEVKPTLDDSLPISGDESVWLDGLNDEQKHRLSELLDAYLRCMEEGATPDRLAMVRDNPDLELILREYFDKLEGLYEFAEGMRDPKILGDFVIEHEIGRGGMGVVYSAYQKSLNRKVALKLLAMASQLDSRQIARFQNEAHAAGLLQHANIVPIYSVGVERGIHYYAMQLIDGIPMDAWVIERSAEMTSSNIERADWRQVVAWGIDIADALHCAHESGVVHRDVKPSNLILDKTNKLWIADFGLARVQQDKGLTISGDVLGTIRYMSPEQAAGRSEMVDHRTDVYSLSATLYELLTLARAIEGEDGPTLLQAILSDEPIQLKELASQTPRDLRVVLEKGVAKQKDDRYASARDFAEDLRAVLENRPTVAKPPSIGQRLGRVAKRHRRTVVVGAAVLSVAMVWLAISSMVIRQKAIDLKFSQERADRYFREAQVTVDRLGTRFAEQLASVPGTEQVRQEILSETLAYYQRFANTAKGDATLVAELAITHNRIGTLIREMRGSAEALPYYRQAADLFSKIVPDDNRSIRQEAARNLNQLALTLVDLGQHSEAMADYQQALSLQHNLLLLEPENRLFATDLALTKNNLALLQRETGDIERARRLLNESILDLQRLLDADAGDELASRGLSAALVNLASLYDDSDIQAAIMMVQRAIDGRLESAKRSGNRLRASAEIAALYENLGSAWMRADDMSQAEFAFDRAIQLRRQLQALSPGLIVYQRDLAISLNNLAIVRQHQRKHDAAFTLLDEAVVLLQQCVDEIADDAELKSQLESIQQNLALSGANLLHSDDADG